MTCDNNCPYCSPNGLDGKPSCSFYYSPRENCPVLKVIEMEGHQFLEYDKEHHYEVVPA